jgi:outer membrane protein assembly factor BamE (lipoprotein component of BamABCDE complex)
VDTLKRALVFAAFLLFLAFCVASGWFRRDTTVYAPGYSEAKYRLVKAGMSREAVIGLLGPPLSVDSAPGYILWMYAASDFRNPRRPANGPASPPAQTFFHADVAGKIDSVHGSYLNIKNDGFFNHHLEEVKAKFGDPIEVYSAPDRELYWYSKMDGVKGHFVRFIEISRQGTVSDISAGCIGYYVGPEDARNLNWLEWLDERVW